jgi:hypothetical protein
MYEKIENAIRGQTLLEMYLPYKNMNSFRQKQIFFYDNSTKETVELNTVLKI